MPFSNSFVPTNFINKSTQATGTPDISAGFLNSFQSTVDGIGDGLATYSSDLEALEATVAALGTPYVDPTHISGLKLTWNSATSITVSAGACYIPATGGIASKSTDTIINPTGLVANTMYYIYAANVGGTLSFDAPSTVTPAAYFGKAKQKSGDSTRRYIGEFRTGSGTTNILNFVDTGNYIQYLTDDWTWSLPYLVINDYRSTSQVSATPVGGSATNGQQLAPVGTRVITLEGAHYASEALLIRAGGVTTTLYDHWIDATKYVQFDVVVTSGASGTFNYRMATAVSSQAAFLGVRGYYRER